MGCTHHWVMEDSRGPMIKGKCRLCGVERQFSNVEASEPRPRRNYRGKGYDGKNIRLEMDQSV